VAGNFAGAIKGWADKTEASQTDILHQALRLLVEEVTRPKSAGGHMPYVTGNLAKSVAVSTLGPVTMEFWTKKFRNSADSVNNSIAGVEVGTTAFIGFRAPYTHKAEAENGFIRLAAQRWPQIFDEAVKAKARS
jgi:hypothetical protein